MTRKQYDLEFKKMVIQKGNEIGNMSAVARQHELDPKMVLRWAKQLNRKDLDQLKPDSKRVAAFIPTADDYKQLERENEKLKKLLAEQALEREILKDLLKKTNPHLRIK
jgi:transposase-like protein